MKEKFNKLGKYEITLVQWQDKWQHWRLGLDWKSEDDYEFICEKPTIEECLDLAIKYVEERHGTK